MKRYYMSLSLIIALIASIHGTAFSDCYDCGYFYKATVVLKTGDVISGYIAGLPDEPQLKNKDTLRPETYLFKEIYVTNLDWFSNRRSRGPKKVIVTNEEDKIVIKKADVVGLKEEESFKRIEYARNTLRVPSKRLLQLLLSSKPVAIHTWGEYNIGMLVSFNNKFKQAELEKFESDSLLYNPAKESEKLTYFRNNDILFIVKSGE